MRIRPQMARLALGGWLVLWLGGCGQTAEVTQQLAPNAALTTATAVAQSAAATITAATGLVPAVPGVVLPSPGAALPGSPITTAVPALATRQATVQATARPSILPSGPPSSVPTGPPSGTRPPLVPTIAVTVGSAQLPAGFPLPPKYEAVSSTDDGRQIVAILTVPSAKDAFEFYKSSLPGAGYQVRDPGTVSVPGLPFIGSLTISNAQFDGNLAFTAAGQSGEIVTIQLRRK